MIGSWHHNKEPSRAIFYRECMPKGQEWAHIVWYKCHMVHGTDNSFVLILLLDALSMLRWRRWKEDHIFSTRVWSFIYREKIYVLIGLGEYTMFYPLRKNLIMYIHWQPIICFSGGKIIIFHVSLAYKATIFSFIEPFHSESNIASQ